MQPTQIAEGAGITTRQRKRVSLEPHQGPGTPEVGDTGSCFVLSSGLPTSGPAHPSFKFEEWIKGEATGSGGVGGGAAGWIS